MKNTETDDQSVLTKREYIAALALQGLAVRGVLCSQEVAKKAVSLADELLKELEKPTKK